MISRHRAAAFAAAALALSPAGLGAQPVLSLPIDCTPGEDCHVQNYVDRKAGPEAADFACGTLSYDGHNGTDFAVGSLTAMRDGVEVRAAAAGIVRGTRDKWPDVPVGAPGAPELGGQDCGNGVAIDHGGGWITQYCHMKLGSVAVRSGDRVEAGQRLGEVGLSGRTEFPHIHMSLFHNGVTVDPFDAEMDPACGPGVQLWSDPLAYRPTGIVGAGLLPRMPDYAELKDAPPPTTAWPAAEGAALVAWLRAFGGRTGDVLRFQIEGPAGRVHDVREVLMEDQADFFRGAGRRAPEGGFPPGRYVARMEIVRDGRVVDAASETVELP